MADSNPKDKATRPDDPPSPPKKAAMEEVLKNEQGGSSEIKGMSLYFKDTADLTDQTYNADDDDISSIGNSLARYASEVFTDVDCLGVTSDQGKPPPPATSIRIIRLVESNDSRTQEEEMSLEVPIAYPPLEENQKHARRRCCLYVMFRQCLPGWIRRAPTRVKVFLGASVLLLLLAVVIGGIAVATVSSDNDQSGLGDSPSRAPPSIFILPDGYDRADNPWTPDSSESDSTDTLTLSPPGDSTPLGSTVDIVASTPTLAPTVVVQSTRVTPAPSSSPVVEVLVSAPTVVPVDTDASRPTAWILIGGNPAAGGGRT